MDKNQCAFTAEDIEKNKTMAGLSYLVFIVGLIMMKDSKFIKFHINQILLIYIPTCILTAFYLLLMTVLLAGLHLKTVMVINVVFTIICILISILLIINMISAFQGEARRIPIFGKITIIPGSNDVEVDDMFHHPAFDKITNSMSNINMQNMSNLSNISAMVECAECGNKVLKGKKFCSKCGATMPPIFETSKNKEAEYSCVQCNKEFKEGIKFCTECGGKVEKKPELGPPTCSACNKVVSSGIKFCPECGGKIVQKEIVKLTCKKCAYEFKSEMKFCPECGEPRGE